VTAEAEDFLRAAMRLSRREQVELAAILADGGDEDEGTPEEIERSWLEEGKRRLEALRQGRMTVVPASEVRKKLEAMLARAPSRSASTG